MDKFWKIKNEADSETAELLIYGQIVDGMSWSDEDVRLKEFTEDIKSLGGKDLLLRINSPGGDIFAAQAIYNILKAYTGKVTAHIDGICASAATLVACGADSVVMPRNALYMIHNPAVCMWETADSAALSKMAATLDKVKDTVVNVYSAKCGDKVSADEVASLMDDETWMDADEALEKGFIDEVDDYAVKTEMKSDMVIVNSVSMPVKAERLKKIKNSMKKERKTGMSNEELISKIKDLFGIKDNGSEPKEDPEVVKERQRISDLEALKAKDANPYVAAFVNKCKATPGMTVETAKQFVNALAGVKAEPTDDERIKAVMALLKDNLESGASGVKGQPKEGKEDPKMKQQADITDIVTRMNTIRGTK